MVHDILFKCGTYILTCEIFKIGGKSSSVTFRLELFLVLFSEGTFSSTVSMTSLSSVVMVAGVLGVSITGTWAVSVGKAEEEKDEGTALGVEEILFFSKNVCLLKASLRRSEGDLFFDLDPWLANPVLVVFKE